MDSGEARAAWPDGWWAHRRGRLGRRGRRALAPEATRQLGDGSSPDLEHRRAGRGSARASKPDGSATAPRGEGCSYCSIRSLRATGSGVRPPSARASADSASLAQGRAGDDQSATSPATIATVDTKSQTASRSARRGNSRTAAARSTAASAAGGPWKSITASAVHPWHPMRSRTGGSESAASQP